VEGTIEPGQPPLVFLTKSQGYFEPTNLNDLDNLIVTGAEVYVTNNGNEVQLTEICSADVPEDLLPLVIELTGFSAEQLRHSTSVCTLLSIKVFGAKQIKFMASALNQTGKHSLLRPK